MAQQESLLGPYLQPGTKIKVGQYSTKIVRYLSEGGFSHVYIAHLDIPVKGSDIAVLKRIVAPDKAALAAIRTEVETMKRLKGHRYIVTYIDSHASALKVGFEVYVLMEYCPGGGLIDFMNTRLQTRLAEWEVLKIISDTAEAVACMHYLRPPLLHRDLKIENVLIAGDGCYKLCDFGSCTAPRPAATNSAERRQLEEDIQKNTTIQYRSPEMVDVSRGQPIDEKSDIWALGVLLYKLCYFTTPFETQGQLAILNAAYTFPPYPPYTDRTKRLIAVTLQEDPRNRPNIYQLVAEICSMRNVPVPIPDIYTKRKIDARTTSRSAERQRQAAPTELLSYEAKEPVQTPPESLISPMRRGRPSKASSPVRAAQPPKLEKPLTQGAHNEVALDSAAFTSKFPSLEEMSFTLASDDRPFEFATTDNEEQHSSKSRLRQDNLAAHPAPSLPTTSMHMAASGDEVERTLKPSEIGKSGNYVRYTAAGDKLSSEGPVASKHFASPVATKPTDPNLSSKLDGAKNHDKNPYHAGNFSSSDEAKSTTHRNIAEVQNALRQSSDLLHKTPDMLERPDQANRLSEEAINPNRINRSRQNILDKRKTIQIDSNSATSVPAASIPSPSLLDKDDVQRGPKVNEYEFRKPSSSSSASDLRRSVSVSSAGKHGKRPSLNSIPSFSGAAKNLMSGKFSDAFKKFENNKKSSNSISNTSAPLTVEENDLPEHITEHIRTTEARRSLSYNRSRPSFEEIRRASTEQPESTPSTSVKEAMRMLKEKANQPYIAKRSAQGYGKYTEAAEIERAATVIPMTRPVPKEKPNSLLPNKQPQLEKVRLVDEDDDFQKRYPSLSEFTV